MSVIPLEFYFRSGCHLCEDMWQHLDELREELGFVLHPVDIDQNAELQQRFGHLIPVLEGEGELICNYYLDPMALRNHLARRRCAVEAD